MNLCCNSDSKASGKGWEKYNPVNATGKMDKLNRLHLWEKLAWIHQHFCAKSRFVNLTHNWKEKSPYLAFTASQACLCNCTKGHRKLFEGIWKLKLRLVCCVGCCLWGEKLLYFTQPGHRCLNYSNAYEIITGLVCLIYFKGNVFFSRQMWRIWVQCEARGSSWGHVQPWLHRLPKPSFRFLCYSLAFRTWGLQRKGTLATEWTGDTCMVWLPERREVLMHCLMKVNPL